MLNYFIDLYTFGFVTTFDTILSIIFICSVIILTIYFTFANNNSDIKENELEKDLENSGKLIYSKLFVLLITFGILFTILNNTINPVNGVKRAFEKGSYQLVTGADIIKKEGGNLSLEELRNYDNKSKSYFIQNNGGNMWNILKNPPSFYTEINEYQYKNIQEYLQEFNRIQSIEAEKELKKAKENAVKEEEKTKEKYNIIKKYN